MSLGMTTRLIGSLQLVALLALGQQRIVSTSPGITETLFALGLGSRVVGVSEHCHYPREVIKLPKVGTFLQPEFPWQKPPPACGER